MQGLEGGCWGVRGVIVGREGGLGEGMEFGFGW